MKKLNYIWLWVAVVCATAPFLIPFMLEGQKMFIKHEMEERMEREELQTLVLDIATIRWEKKEKEIWLGDQLFDIKEMKQEGNKLIVKGLYDHKEKEILSKLNTFHHPLPFEHERNKTVFKLIHLEAIVIPADNALHLIFVSLYSSDHNRHWSSLCQGVLSPPPENVLA